jgi:hypothetical protein
MAPATGSSSRPVTGCSTPTPSLPPYDLSLRQLSPDGREAWGDRVAVELTDRFPAGTVLWFHAGALYRDAIAPLVPHQVRFPLAGLGIGEQLAWYRRHVAAIDEGRNL